MKTFMDFILWLDWPAIICCTPVMVYAYKKGWIF